MHVTTAATQLYSMVHAAVYGSCKGYLSKTMKYMKALMTRRLALYQLLQTQIQSKVGYIDLQQDSY